MRERVPGNYQTYAQAVADAKRGVQEAFAYLYESTYRDKWYIAQKYMRNETEAQDVLQDAYVKAWQNLDRLQEPEKFPGWLSTIVASTALDAMKKKKELPFSAMETETEEGDSFAYEEEDLRTQYRPEHAYTDMETSALLREMLDALSEEQRFCMLMYYVEEHSVGEIARVIGCSENTVKSRLNYGRKNLRAKAEELQRKGYTLYGLTAIPAFRMLLRAEKTAQVSGGVASATAAAGGTAGGTAIGVKIAVGLLSVALIGGGGYAAVRYFTGGGGGTATLAGEGADGNTGIFPDRDLSQNDSGTPAPGVDGESDVFLAENPVFDRLSFDVQDTFRALIDRTREDPENMSYAWIYHDKDSFPELLIRTRDGLAEDIDTVFIYHGTTAKVLFDTALGEELALLNNRRTAPALYGTSTAYFVPGEGLLIDEFISSGVSIRATDRDIAMERALMTIIYDTDGKGNVETAYQVIRAFTGDGKEEYYAIPMSDGDQSGDTLVMSVEEYERMRYSGKRVCLFP